MFVLQPRWRRCRWPRCRSWSLIAWPLRPPVAAGAPGGQQRIAELTADAEENVSGVRVVKAFAQEDRQLDALRALGGAGVRPADVRDPDPGPLHAADQLPAATSGWRLILLVGGRDVIDGSLTIGEFTAFYAYLLMLISPMRTLGYMLERRAARDRIGRAHLPGARPRAADHRPAGRAGAARRARPRLAARRQPDLRRAPPSRRCATSTSRSSAGRTVALVGAMGSGKTALVSLLPRLYDVSAGSVRIDGADVRSVDLDSLRAADRDRHRRPVPVLGHDPRQHRLRAPRRHARGGRARRPPSLRPTRFIERLPTATTRCVGERGLTLSGGQRQRIAIARAVLADPRILMLDDATSSVDASTEQEIKRGARRGDGRADDVRDRAPSVDDRAGGRDRRARARRVAAHGTHDELLEESPLYREIVEKGMPDQVFMTRNALGAVGL